jgi:hypothetical protein
VKAAVAVVEAGIGVEAAVAAGAAVTVEAVAVDAAVAVGVEVPAEVAAEEEAATSLRVCFRVWSLPFGYVFPFQLGNGICKRPGATGSRCLLV